MRIVDLRTSDRVFVPVWGDGEFRAWLFAPPGSWLQINSVMVAAEDLPPEAKQRLRTRGAIYHAQVSQEPAEPWIEFLTGHPSSSPGTVVLVAGPRESGAAWPGFVKRVGPDLRLFGRAWASRTSVQPGDSLDVTIELRSVGSSEGVKDAIRDPPQLDFFVHSLFDASGRQRPRRRLSVSHLLTPTAFPTRLSRPPKRLRCARKEDRSSSAKRRDARNAIRRPSIRTADDAMPRAGSSSTTLARACRAAGSSTRGSIRHHCSDCGAPIPTCTTARPGHSKRS